MSSPLRDIPGDVDRLVSPVLPDHDHHQPRGQPRARHHPLPPEPVRPLLPGRPRQQHRRGGTEDPRGLLHHAVP